MLRGRIAGMTLRCPSPSIHASLTSQRASIPCWRSRLIHRHQLLAHMAAQQLAVAHQGQSWGAQQPLQTWEAKVHPVERQVPEEDGGGQQ